jgi:transcriptional regulator with XRE-family HTH domain
MDEVKLAVASNIIKLRTRANMTQTELGEKLNYSDKTISKWERAEALPDVVVLKRIGEVFEVSVDYLLGAHNQWEMPRDAAENAFANKYSSSMITRVAIAGIWTLAIFAFVITWVLGTIQWSIFAYAVPVSLVTVLVLNTIWHNGKNNLYIVAALVLSIIAVIYIILIEYQPWQLFLVAIPAELVVFFSFRIKKRKLRH